MPIAPTSMQPAPLTPRLEPPQVGHAFSKQFWPSDMATDRPSPPETDVIRQSAEELVAMTFFKPMLERARQDPFRTDLFHGGFAEDAFGAHLDTIIAQRLTQGVRLPLVDAVYNRFANALNKVDTHG